ncbi:MAG TPA: RIO1 family regulatory kinase/ATPase [Actinomycetota bacterium]
MTRIYEGERPAPPHVITEDYVEDVELGIVKTGKEADVYLVERRAPGRSCLLAAKRYRAPDHRAFANDAAYRQRRTRRVRDGARVRAATKLRVDRAVEGSTSFGREVKHGAWIEAEFQTLSRLWQVGAPVPYPVERLESGVLMQFIGEDGVAAPRLQEARVPAGVLTALFEQAVEALRAIARAGIVHADLSPYNVLVWDERLVVIDVPQAVPYLDNTEATGFLHRDVTNLVGWFRRRGLDVDPEEVFVTVLNDLFDYRMEDMFFAH